MGRKDEFNIHYQTLGVAVGATADELQRAFRELVHSLHPDLNPRDHDRRRFVEVVRAYRILREKLRRTPQSADFGRCVRCRKFDDLFDPLGSGGTCADCLLGETQRRRLLPAPLIVVAKHAAVAALYIASILFTIALLRSETAIHGLLAVLCAFGGLLLLSYEVVFRTDDR